MNIVDAIYIQEPLVANTERSILEAGPSTSPNKKEDEVKFIMIQLVFFFFLIFVVQVEELINYKNN